MGLGKQPVIYRPCCWVSEAKSLDSILRYPGSDYRQNLKSLMSWYWARWLKSSGTGTLSHWRGRAELNGSSTEENWTRPSNDTPDLAETSAGVRITVWRQDWVLTFNRVDPRGQTQVPRLGCRYVIHWVSSKTFSPFPPSYTGTLTGPFFPVHLWCTLNWHSD